MKDKVRLFDMAMKMEDSGNLLAALELGKRCLALGVDKKFKASYKHPKTGNSNIPLCKLVCVLV